MVILRKIGRFHFRKESNLESVSRILLFGHTFLILRLYLFFFSGSSQANIGFDDEMDIGCFSALIFAITSFRDIWDQLKSFWDNILLELNRKFLFLDCRKKPPFLKVGLRRIEIERRLAFLPHKKDI